MGYRDTLSLLPSMTVKLSDGTPVAWAFLGKITWVPKDPFPEIDTKAQLGTQDWTAHLQVSTARYAHPNNIVGHVRNEQIGTVSGQGAREGGSHEIIPR